MTTILIGLLFAAAALALAAQHAYWRRHLDAVNAHWQGIHDTEVGRLDDDLTAVRSDATEAEVQRDAYARKIDQLARDKTKAEVDLEWARIVIASQGLELDRHFLMPTITGKRAEVAERRRQADNVVPLRDPKAGA